MPPGLLPLLTWPWDPSSLVSPLLISNAPFLYLEQGHFSDWNRLLPVFLPTKDLCDTKILQVLIHTCNFISNCTTHSWWEHQHKLIPTHNWFKIPLHWPGELWHIKDDWELSPDEPLNTHWICCCTLTLLMAPLCMAWKALTDNSFTPNFLGNQQITEQSTLSKGFLWLYKY